MAELADETDRSLVDAALEALGIGVWSYDVWRDRFRCDARTARLFGLSEEERRAGVSISRVGEAVHPDDRERYWARRRFTLRFGGDFTLEYRTVPRQGVQHRVIARGCYRADAVGVLVEARGIVIDITGRDADVGDQVFAVATVGTMVDSPAIERAAMHAIAAHREIKDSDSPEGRLLRPAADALLAEIVRVIALSAPARGLGH